MKYIRTAIPAVVIIEPRLFEDDRGWFMETFRSTWMREITGADVDFAQDNHSRSTGPVVRGLHYQLPSAQGKLVRVVRGAIWDVAVDLRASSPTFGHWTAVELSEQNKRQLWLPVGFAHGFAALSDMVDVTYKTTDYYNADADRTLAWDDPSLAIDWPTAKNDAILSARDTSGLSFEKAPKFD